MKWPASEQDLASRVVEYFQAERWDVYQEVQVWQGGAVADIVVKRGPVVAVGTGLGVSSIGPAACTGKLYSMISLG